MDEPDPAALRERYLPRLRQELAALSDASDQTAEDRKPVALDQTSVGRLSRMDAMQQQAMAAALEVRRAGRIRLVETAIARLAGEDFGWCAGCGAFIGLKRLDLDPVILRCVRCAS